MWEPSGSEPPVFALVFNDSKAAGQILTELYKEVGPEDRHDVLRISVIRHIDKHNPDAYRVIVASNPMAALSTSAKKIVLAVSRVHTMTPASSSILDNFIKCFTKTGSYFFTYAIPVPGGQELDLAPEPPIVKTHLHVREAWQIGLNDLDGAGVLKGDEPIIPLNEAEAPVGQLLQWKQR